MTYVLGNEHRESLTCCCGFSFAAAAASHAGLRHNIPCILPCTEETTATHDNSSPLTRQAAAVRRLQPAPPYCNVHPAAALQCRIAVQQRPAVQLHTQAQAACTGRGCSECGAQCNDRKRPFNVVRNGKYRRFCPS